MHLDSIPGWHALAAGGHMSGSASLSGKGLGLGIFFTPARHELLRAQTY
jgi:hypothetical protein